MSHNDLIEKWKLRLKQQEAELVRMGARLLKKEIDSMQQHNLLQKP